jgi:hypothetical protein
VPRSGGPFFFMRSIPNGTKKIRPGPFALVSRPSLKTTPRSYSYRTRKLDSRATTPMTAAGINRAPKSMMHHLQKSE